MQKSEMLKNLKKIEEYTEERRKLGLSENKKIQI